MPDFAVVPREDVEQLAVQVAAPQHAVDEVRPIERSDQHQRLLQPQLGDDVAPHALGRRRGERVERDAREIVAQPSELPVLRPEIVAPLADAVRLVDRDEAHVRLLQQPPQRLAAFADQPLGRHVQQAAAVRRARSRAPRRARAAAACCSSTTRRRRRRAGRRPDPSSARSAARRPARSRRRRRGRRGRTRSERPPAPGSRATCRRRSAARRRCRARRGWRASLRAAADGSRRSPRRGGARRAAAPRRDQRPGVAVVLDVVVDQTLELRRELVVGAAQRRDVLAVDEDRAARLLAGAGQADADVRRLRLAGTVDDAAHHGERHRLDAFVASSSTPASCRGCSPGSARPAPGTCVLVVRPQPGQAVTLGENDRRPSACSSSHAA